MSRATAIAALKSANHGLSEVQLAADVLGQSWEGEVFLSRLYTALKDDRIDSLTEEQRTAATFLFNAALRGNYQHTARIVISEAALMSGESPKL